jgi:hypothetical protein
MRSALLDSRSRNATAIPHVLIELLAGVGFSRGRSKGSRGLPRWGFGWRRRCMLGASRL